MLCLCSQLVVLHFSAAWAPQCKQMNDVMEELSKDSQYTNVQFAKVKHLLHVLFPGTVYLFLVLYLCIYKYMYS